MKTIYNKSELARISKENHTWLKIHAAQNETTLSAILNKLISEMRLKIELKSAVNQTIESTK